MRKILHYLLSRFNSRFYHSWRDCPQIPGWKIRTDHFDYGNQIGVAVWNGKTGPDCVRNAVTIIDSENMTELQAMKEAIPSLKTWVENR